MSSATEDAEQIREVILQLFSFADEAGSFKPETAHLFRCLDEEDDDSEE